MRFLGILCSVSSVVAAVAPSQAHGIQDSSNDIVPAVSVRTSLLRPEKDRWGNKPSYQRKTVSIRASKDDSDDVSDEFLKAMKKANNGGLFHLKEGKTYVIGKKLDLTFLNDVHVQIDGEIKFTNNITYWQANNFFYDFQNSITFWVWGGKDIIISGCGTLNGNGQAWYNGFAGHQILDPNNTYLRPILFTTDNATNVDVSGIKFLDSPCWNTFLVRTKGISFDSINIEATSNNASAPPANTDGFDTYNSDGISVTRTTVNNGDDCFSPKSNTTNIFVSGLHCNGSHGVSMGSIGQYSGVLDYISNAHIENVTLLNGQNGARLKAWAGQNVGYGYINNVTYKDIQIENTDNPILLDQCYFDVDPKTCAKYPSAVNITNVKFVNIRGTSSGKEGRVVGDLVCSPGATCSGIHLAKINLTSPAGSPPIIECDNIKGGIGVKCVSSSDVSGSLSAVED